MARSPILPASYPSTGLSLYPDQLVLVIDTLSSSGTLDNFRPEMFAEKLNILTREYLNAREVSINQPIFHKAIKEFRESIEEFIQAIPVERMNGNDTDSALVAKIVDQWRIERYSGRITSQGVDTLTRKWIFAFPELASFYGLKEGLTALAQTVEALAKKEGVGERGKPAFREDHAFVQSCAELYQASIGRRPTLSVNPDGTDHRGRAGGHFARFIKAVDDAVYGSLVVALTTQKVIGVGKDARPMEVAEAEICAGKSRLRGIDNLIASLPSGITARK